MSRHRPPPLLAAHHRAISIANGGLLALAATVGIANTFAPHADATTPAAMPTAVDVTEPVGHGGPLALPTFPTDVWTPDAGPVITDGQPLATAEPTRAQRKQRAEETETTTPEPTPPAPEPGPAPEPPVAAAEPAPTGLLALVNADRATAGCAPVTANDSLMAQSQAHSDQQAAADEMDHSGGVDGFGTWGENVAVGVDTEAAVHALWMSSEGHRANVLNCAYTVFGYGSAVGASGRYWTEMFAA